MNSSILELLKSDFLPIMKFCYYFCWSLIFHLLGDYIFQNDWLANEKTKRNFPAFLHALIYSLPFLSICWSYWWFLIFISHFFIDRFRLVVYWIKLVNWNLKSENFGYDEDKPKFMSIWLMIIIDNCFHIIINTISIYCSIFM
jgi:hypothetical protein